MARRHPLGRALLPPPCSIDDEDYVEASHIPKGERELSNSLESRKEASNADPASYSLRIGLISPSQKSAGRLFHQSNALEQEPIYAKTPTRRPGPMRAKTEIMLAKNPDFFRNISVPKLTFGSPPRRQRGTTQQPRLLSSSSVARSTTAKSTAVNVGEEREWEVVDGNALPAGRRSCDDGEEYEFVDAKEGEDKLGEELADMIMQLGRR